MLLAILLIQAVFGPPIPKELSKPAMVLPCPVDDSSGDIVVCGQNDAHARLDKLPDRFAEPSSDPLSFRLPGGGKGNVHAFQNDLPGATSQGIAATIKIPFGGKAKRQE